MIYDGMNLALAGNLVEMPPMPIYGDKNLILDYNAAGIKIISDPHVSKHFERGERPELLALIVQTWTNWLYD